MNNDFRELKFALYARKSSESEERQIQSIDDQLRLMKEIAVKNGLTVTTVVSESRSAKTPGNRPEFDRLIGLLKAGEINGILTWQVNRLTRNPSEGGVLQQLLQDGLIQCIFTHDKTYLPGDNALFFSIESSMANQFVRDLMVNVRRGMYSKVDKGWFPGVPPTGYKNHQDEVTREKTIIADPERFMAVRRMWDMMLEGGYTVRQITREMADEGLTTIPRRRRGGGPLSVSAVHAMFRNPFYYGMLRYGNASHQGLHPPMVTKEEFDRVQELIGVGNRHRPTVDAPTDHFAAYRGLIACGECGCSITYSRKVRRYKNGQSQVFEYCYCTNRRPDYECTNRVKVRPSELTRLIRAELEKYTISEDFFLFACKYLNEYNEAQAAKHTATLELEHKAIGAVENELYGLQKMLYTGRCTEDFFDLERQ